MKDTERHKGSARVAPDEVEDQASQSARFIEAARSLGCKDRLDRFDAAVRRIGKARKSPEPGVVGEDRRKEQKPKWGRGALGT